MATRLSTKPRAATTSVAPGSREQIRMSAPEPTLEGFEIVPLQCGRDGIRAHELVGSGADMRICSLLPGATEVVAALGLVDNLVAISHECDYPPEIRHKPVIIRSAVDPRKTSSPAIDRQVRDALKNGSGLYRIDEALLRRLEPDLIITQSLCEVCAVTPSEVQRALDGLKRTPQLLSLNPTSLEDVYRDIEAIGKATGRDVQAHRLVDALRGRSEEHTSELQSRPQ